MDIKICRTCGIEKNIQEFAMSGKYYRCDCKMCHNKKIKEYCKKYYINNKKRLDYINKKYREEHKEKMKNYNKVYYKENKETIIKNVNEYRKKNKTELIKKQEIYNNIKRKENKIFRLKTNIRNMINRSFTRKEYQKNKHTEEILGCNIDFFIKHLFETFKKNYGYEYDGIEKVHIDHIIPLATAKTEEEVIKLCHYTNLQLLKAKDNLIKGTKILEKE